ncbi:U-box domain-containing protein 29-like [Phragmites australis]|uniref:U-box domain-containing protein 29-like n=1 Tax=Phragmites australis TaxID=29695 RepID=UPI002D796B96|nr:U-box domain-containing protein 29-like [Phragmites australis]
MDAAVVGQQARRRIQPPAPIVMAAAPPTPAAFRCPISLEVMRSPVSLPTGATYDRASIQRWLDSGHRTCPATRLPLASTDLVPNLLLRRLIHLHAATLPPSPSPEQVLSQLAAADGEPAAAEKAVRSLAAKIAPEKGKQASVASAVAADLDSAVPALLSFAKGGAGADARVDAVRILATVAPELVSYLTEDGAEKRGRMKMAVEALAAVLSADRVREETKEALIVTLVAGDLGRVLTTLLGAGANGAAVLEAVLTSPAADADAKTAIADRSELFTDLVRILRDAASPAAIRCMAAAVQVRGRPARASMVRAGAVPALALAVAAAPTAAAESALRLLAEAARCGDGKAAIAADAAEVAAAVMGRMIRVGPAGREAAVAVLWLSCCAGGGERRMREAVAAAPEAVGKLLVVMQGDCSPTTSRMAGDLLRAVRLEQERKGMTAAYDSRTIHVMPY